MWRLWRMMELRSIFVRACWWTEESWQHYFPIQARIKRLWNSLTLSSGRKQSIWSSLSLRCAGYLRDVMLPKLEQSLRRYALRPERYWALEDEAAGQGFLQSFGIDFFDTYAPVAHMTSFCLINAMAVYLNLFMNSMDMDIAFLNAELKAAIP